jgi:flagellar biosynthetic protein FliR
MGVFAFNEVQVLIFFSALMRIGFLFMLVPLFNDSRIPNVIKILLSFAITLILNPVIQHGAANLNPETFNSSIGIIVLLVKEAAVGLLVGFVAKIFFDAINFAFSHAGTLMGFNMASAFDQSVDTEIPIISQFIVILAMMIFLAVDGHHMLLKATLETFKVVPVGGVVIERDAFAYVLSLAGEVFWIAVRLSAPMALVLFLINCGFGIIAKAVPQINVLMVSFAVNIIAGLMVIFLTMPVFGTSVTEIFGQMFSRMWEMLHLMT